MTTNRCNVLALLLACLLLVGCATHQPLRRQMEVTAYCGCKECCDWTRGSWRFLKLNWWNKYVDHGPGKGKPYEGLTASGVEPREPYPGLFSRDSLAHPWVIPVRLILFPWLLPARDGTVAADAAYFPFGTRLYIPGYGFGRVQDRGGAIKGPNRLDVYFDSHDEALRWGRQSRKVSILE